MKKFHKLIGFILSLTMITLISGCGGGSSSTSTVATSTPTGIMSLSITDAPMLPDVVTEVNIAVIGIAYNHDGNWTEAEDFIPQTFNLLDLDNGKSLYLGDLVLPAGDYKEIRFILAAPEKDADVKSNPDTNITFADGTSEPLFVPSGSSSGFKAKGDFTITADAKIAIMADFNVEKSIVVKGNATYSLKPVIRIIVTELSGTISGTVLDFAKYTGTDALVVYTYEGSIDEAAAISESTPNSDGIRFLNAVSSTDVNMSDGSYILSFLEAASYTLVTAQYTGSTFIDVVDIEDNVEVLMGETTTRDLNTSD